MERSLETTPIGRTTRDLNMSVVLGRRLLRAADTPVDAAATGEEMDAVLVAIQADDRFFCDVMELIPAQMYFPTDEEENWKKSAPKTGKKYHRDILAQKQVESSKKAIKKAKFNPSEQKTNEERQLEAAEVEKKQKKEEKAAIPVQTAKDPSTVSIDGLKERLAAKLAAMREQRKADEKDGKKRKANASAKKEEPASKKRKAATTAASNGSAFNNKGKNQKQENGHAANAVASSENGKAEQINAEVEVSASSISYGSLLLADENKTDKKKTRNGQAVRGIKNLLKKAERNQQRMEELKKTEEGKALVQAKNWNKALKQAAGEVVLDDPKLLRKKLKKKEKTKAKSTKEWKKRTAQVEISKKEKQKKRLENMLGGGRHAKKDKKGDKPAAPRAGFEGKKGEGFLNADKKAGGATSSSGAAKKK